VKKAFVLAVVGLAMVMTMLSLWQYTTIRAIGPADLLPMQPFNPQAVGGIGAHLGSGNAPMTLGDRNVENYTSTTIIRGERFGVPWIYSGPGFDLDPYKKSSAVNAGTIISTTDANCQSTSAADVGVAAKNIADGGHKPVLPNDLGTPYDWVKTTTNVEGTSDSWLKSAMPPFSFIFRHTASMNNLWLGASTEYALNPPLKLNTVYTSVPFSPNNSAFTATTKLGGDPNLPSTSSAVCTDSPQSSISITTPYSNPPKLGDSGKPCLAGEPCADAVINGLWTDNVINATSATPTTRPVTSKIFNSGPAPGTFSYHWDIELTNAAIMDAVWMPENAKQVDDPVAALAAGATLTLTNDLKVSCTGTGEGLVVLKGILWPIIPITREPYPDDNASIFVVKAVCNSGAPVTQVDKEVIWVKPDLSGGSVPPGGVDDPREWTKDASHVETVMGDPGVIVYLDELKSNHEPSNVMGKEWLEAETFAPGPIWSWNTALTIDQGTPPGTSKTAAYCSGSDPTCITFDVTEPFGQSDVHAQALVRCPLGIPEGEYSVVVKAIDAPVGIGESKPSDNAARMVIDVFCWESEAHHTLAMDGIDDGAGLYPKWTVFLSDPDKRKPFASPPSLSSDTAGAGGAGVSPPNGGYFERLVRLECYWMDVDGCHPDAAGLLPCPGAAKGYLTSEESHADFELATTLGGYLTIDSDQDCVQDYKSAQPGHPIEDQAAQPAGTCDTAAGWTQYAGKPNDAANTKAADNDCDGLVDGVERGYGSSPKLADTDGDTAKDFVELFQFSSPLNPDTDGDGFADKPVATFQNSNTTMDNCPSVANANQLNSDGAQRPNGPSIPGTVASQPNGDKAGNACDADDDNDGLVDNGELLCAPGPEFNCPVATCKCDLAVGTRPTATTCQLNSCDPLDPDTDGDRCTDLVELLTGRNPLNPASTCLSLGVKELKFFRACRWNLPQLTEDGGYWDTTKYSTNTDRTELDADGDGVSCLTPTGNIGDDDNDNGRFDIVPANALLEINDQIELKGYYTNASLRDTDGDGCDDWLEIMDINGDRVNSVGDLSALAKRGSPSPPVNFTPDPISDPIYDVNKDGLISVGDLSLMARNSCVIKPYGGGCAPQPCLSEQ